MLLCCHVPLWMKAVLSPPIHPYCSVGGFWALGSAPPPQASVALPFVGLTRGPVGWSRSSTSTSRCKSRPYVCVASADKWRETLIMRRSSPLAAKPVARLICSISPAVNNWRAHPSACSQMSLSDRLYDVLLLTSPPVMRVFPQVACLHGAAYHQGLLRETQTSPTPNHPAWYRINFPFSHPVAFIGQRSPGTPAPPPLLWLRKAWATSCA